MTRRRVSHNIDVTSEVRPKQWSCISSFRTSYFLEDDSQLDPLTQLASWSAWGVCSVDGVASAHVPPHQPSVASVRAHLPTSQRCRASTRMYADHRVCVHTRARSLTYFAHPAVMRVRAPCMPRSRRFSRPIFARASAHACPLRSPSHHHHSIARGNPTPSGEMPMAGHLELFIHPSTHRSISPRRAQTTVRDVAPRIIALTLTCSATHPVARAHEHTIFYRTYHFKELLRSYHISTRLFLIYILLSDKASQDPKRIPESRDGTGRIQGLPRFQN
ncbi:hypothetical protein HD554DRAFT_2071901 [Boletus coccyginus]|nr:hypothetical protein HD554DRAFT_2071901 [Boletus coccyginus]